MNIEDYKKQKQEREAIYSEWKRKVNISVSELRAFLKTKEGKDAGLSRSEAADLGIKSGQESAEWIIKMKKTIFARWTDEMFDWAKRQINFIDRMSGNQGPLYNPKGDKTPKHTSLLLWGHNPDVKNGGGGLGSFGLSVKDMEYIEEWKKLFNMTLREVRRFNEFLFMNPQIKQDLKVSEYQVQSSKKGSTVYSGLGNSKFLVELRKKPAKDWTKVDLTYAKDFEIYYKFVSKKLDHISKKSTVYRWQAMGINFRTDTSIRPVEIEDIENFKSKRPTNVEPMREFDFDDHYKVLHSNFLRWFNLYGKGFTIQKRKAPSGSITITGYVDYEPKFIYDEATEIFKTNEYDKTVLPIGKQIENPKKDRGDEIKIGMEIEEEHRDTLEDISKGKITVDEAVKRTVMDHIKEHAQYYTKLKKMEQSFGRGGSIDITDPEWAIENSYSTKQITEKIRKFVKEEYPEYKFSVTKKDNSIYVKLMSADEYPFSDTYDSMRQYKGINPYYIEKDTDLNPWVREMFQDIKDFSDHYNWRTGHTVNFYFSPYIGWWDSPFELKKSKGKPKPKPKAKPAPTKPKLPIPKDLPESMVKEIKKTVENMVIKTGEDLRYMDWRQSMGIPESVQEIMEEEQVINTALEVVTGRDASIETRETLNELEQAKNIFLSDQINIPAAANNYFWAAIGNKPESTEDYTKTAEFKLWFGDWQGQEKEIVSKIVNEQGSPLVVYHGTKMPYFFARFDFTKFPVMYFAKNKSYADWFAKLGNGLIYECYLDIKFLADFRGMGYKDVYWEDIVSWGRMFNIDFPSKHPSAPEYYAGPFWSFLRNDMPHMTLINAVKKAGYNGIAHIENNPSDIVDGKENVTEAFMTFESVQSKLISNTDYSSYNPVTFMKKGGQVKKKGLMDKIKNLGL